MDTQNNKQDLALVRKALGFTLIELMIVVAIIAILAAVALPSYQSYVAKGYREDAKAELLSFMQAQSRYYAQNLTYSADNTNFGYPVAGDTAMRENPRYTINAAGEAGAACTANDCSEIRITASLVAGFADPTCGNLWVNSLGQRGSTVGNNATCWQ